MSAREQRIHTRLHTWVMWRACNSTGTSVQLHGGARVTREPPPNINKLVSTVFVVSHVHVYETTIRLAQQLCPDDELPASAYHVTRRKVRSRPGWGCRTDMLQGDRWWWAWGWVGGETSYFCYTFARMKDSYSSVYSAAGCKMPLLQLLTGTKMDIVIIFKIGFILSL